MCELVSPAPLQGNVIAAVRDQAVVCVYTAAVAYDPRITGIVDDALAQCQFGLAVIRCIDTNNGLVCIFKTANLSRLLWLVARK